MRLTACIVCGKPGRGSRCSQHALPPKSERYDADHRRRRAALLARAYYTRCPICGELMKPGEDLDLDHSIPLAVDPNAKGDRIAHASCNRGRQVA